MVLTNNILYKCDNCYVSCLYSYAMDQCSNFKVIAIKLIYLVHINNK